MANVLGRFCGQSRPPTIQSDKGVLSVRFVSDDSTNKPGFMASYRTLSYTNPNARSRRSAALSNGPHPNGKCGCNFSTAVKKLSLNIFIF